MKPFQTILKTKTKNKKNKKKNKITTKTWKSHRRPETATKTSRAVGITNYFEFINNTFFIKKKGARETSLICTMGTRPERILVPEVATPTACAAEWWPN
jgi:hypothetical protein